MRHPRNQFNLGLSSKEMSAKKSDKRNYNKCLNINLSDHLENLKSEVNALDCNLKEVATNLVFSDGNYNSSVMVLGEAPGANEDIEGKPFVGEAGKLLDKMLSYIDLNRDNFYISNIVFWRPPGNRTPNDKEISICLPLTKKHIGIIKPKLLILVGSIAAKSLLHSKDGITKLRGREHFYKDEELNLKIPARAIFHPAYLFRNPIEKKRTWEDLLEIDELIKKENIL
tara:strand:- start:876 stop:1556 length:681 start_codon:yes stop_codon:yes gene_type:complete